MHTNTGSGASQDVILLGNSPITTSDKVSFMEVTVSKNTQDLSIKLGLAAMTKQTLKLVCCYNLLEGTVISQSISGTQKSAVQPALLGDSIGYPW